MDVLNGRVKGWSAGVILGAVLLALVPGLAWAQSLPEPQLRAEFLVKFAKFTTWPESELGPTSPIAICAIEGPVADALLRMTAEGRRIGDHLLMAGRVPLTERFRGCAVLYLGSLERSKVQPVLARLRGSSVLTVGDGNTFAVMGGVLGLVLENGRMHFVVNRSAADGGQFRLGADLLGVARPMKE